MTAGPGRTVDFALDGIARVRTTDPGPGNLATLSRLLGPPVDVGGEPDLAIRFVDRIEPSSRRRLIGLNEAAFTEDAFLLLRRDMGRNAIAAVPLAQLGTECEIVCERAWRGVPLLVSILNLTLLDKGVLPLHGSAFSYRGVGAVAAGWSKSGKTETLLAFVRRGADAIADEWTYVAGEERVLRGAPSWVRLTHQHLVEAPEYQAAVGRAARLRLRTFRALEEAQEAAARSRPGTPGLRAGARLLRLLASRSYVDVAPVRLFGSDRSSFQGRLDRIFFLLSTDTSEVRVEPMNPEEVASRMVFAHQHHRRDLLEAYLQFRFAFPELFSPVIESAEQTERNLLRKVLGSVTAYRVEHPYPPPLEAIFQAMRPYLA